MPEARAQAGPSFGLGGSVAFRVFLEQTVTDGMGGIRPPCVAMTIRIAAALRAFAQTLFHVPIASIA